MTVVWVLLIVVGVAMIVVAVWPRKWRRAGRGPGEKDGD
jgi:hypothetical protein